MIVDRLDNIGLYEGVSPEISEGLFFLTQVEMAVALGTYQVSDRIKAIVSSYKTEVNRMEEYEAHQRVIDIQYPVCGRELVMWSPVDQMRLVHEYDSDRDVAFWDMPTQQARLIIGAGVFAVFFPGDAHRPCMAVDGQEECIKKVTLKISV